MFETLFLGDRVVLARLRLKVDENTMLYHFNPIPRRFYEGEIHNEQKSYCISEAQYREALKNYDLFCKERRYE